MRDHDADRRDYLFRFKEGGMFRVKHAKVMAAGGPRYVYASGIVKYWWRDGDDEPGSPKAIRRAIARIVYDTLMQRATQNQLEML
jgi:hypothetical protein